MSSAKNDQIKAELATIREKHGRLTAKDVVAEARKNKKLLLHKMFDWNVSRAAQKYWQDRAAEIIVRYVTVTIVHKNKKVTSVYWVRDPTLHSNEPGYCTVAELDRKQSTEMLLEELDRIEANIVRGRGLALQADARHPGLHDMFEDMLEKLIIIREKLKAA